MAILSIIFVFIGVFGLLNILLLFLVQDTKVNKLMFTGTVLLGILISILTISSLPSNDVTLKVVAGVWGLLALIGVVFRIMHKFTLAKVFASASVILGMIQLFFF
ncbi:hypothetical protein [Paenibacillus pini]|uniref:Uncharacterized protein n=1 Tax=Paenibacillus pini JCM 16418 TaxID=1236976 RepID=W7YJZ5_9BACL|nr:hypothetical protein [Paenibacillus pini]GAF08827.1 hypothetical protein JCM16418_2934 [Paenibacillus pini JCM 16418]